MEKSNFLPTFTSDEALAGFLSANAKEKFEDERKHYYSEDEINSLARESSVSGGEILALDEIFKQVKASVTKGNEEAYTIEIPATAGVEVLTQVRKDKDLRVRKGFETVKQTVYGLVDDTRETMRYFNEQGVEVEERERTLSAKEKREYLGMFMQVQRTGTEG